MNEALALADWLDTSSNGPLDNRHKAAALLRTQHAEIERKDALLLDALSAMGHLGGWSAATHRVAEAITSELAK